MYDYRLDDAGLMKFGKDVQEEEDEEGAKKDKTVRTYVYCTFSKLGLNINSNYYFVRA